MTAAESMLKSTPSEIGFSVDELAACIDACFECAQACTACADACLAEDMVAEMRRCITTDLNWTFVQPRARCSRVRRCTAPT